MVKNNTMNNSNTSGVKKLVFLELTDETNLFLRRYIRQVKADPEGFKIVSFHPLVKAQLLKHNIYSIDSFHFCPNSSHQKLLDKLDEFTQGIRLKCALSDAIGVKESYINNFLFSFRCPLAHWLYRTEIISNAIEYYKPGSVITIGPQEGYVAKSLWVEQSERCIGYIVNCVCAAQSIPTENILMRIPAKPVLNSIRKISGNLVKGILCAVLRHTTEIKKNNIVVPMIGHNMISVINDLRKGLGQDWDIVILDLPFNRAVQYLKNRLFTKNNEPFVYFPVNADKKTALTKKFAEQKQNFVKNLFSLAESWNYKGVPLPNWIKLKYSQVLENETINKTYYQAVNISRFLDIHKPTLVLSQYSRGMTAVMGELCRIKKIPSLMIPHGSFTAIADECSKKEWQENALGIVDTPYEYLALQTPLIERFLADISVHRKTIITGPLIFGRQCRNGADNSELRNSFALQGEKIILHASTPKHRQGHRFLNYETIDEYVDGLAALVRAVDKIEGIKLIIRYRPIDGLNAEELRHLLPVSDKYFIACDGSFADYLSIASLLVSYSSTTLEEALQNNIPILVFNKYNRYEHIKGKELYPNLADMTPTAVYNVNSEENLLPALQWIYKNHLCRDITPEGLFDKYKYHMADRVKLSEFMKDTILPLKGGIF